MNYKIEQIGIHEIKNLMEISEETYRDTFEGTTSKENLNAYIESAYNFYQLREEIADKNSMFFFVYQNDDILAYMKLNINEAQTEIVADSALEIQRIYVRKKYQGQGFGKRLFNKAVEITEKLNKTTIWLGVWEYNENAKIFYKALGFEQVGSHPFIMGTDEQTDLILAKNI